MARCVRDGRVAHWVAVQRGEGRRAEGSSVRACGRVPGRACVRVYVRACVHACVCGGRLCWAGRGQWGGRGKGSLGGCAARWLRVGMNTSGGEGNVPDPSSPVNSTATPLCG